jgi:hypothetical protein
MRTEHDLRSALRVLKRETPDAETVLRHVAERTGARTAGRGGRPRRRFLASAAAASAVIAIVVVAALVATPTPPRGHSPTSAPDALGSAPRYYMAFVPVNLKSYEQSGLADEDYAVVKDRITGQTLADVRPPRPYITFVGVYGAADDRTFVLAAQSTIAGSQTTPDKFFYARFNPADNAVTLTPLALPGLPVSNNFAAAALSPDGTRLAVASQIGPVQITVYSLPSGAARTWSADVSDGMPFVNDIVDLLSWSSTGILAFGWGGSGGVVIQNGHRKLDKSLESPGGEYLLNTNTAGGSLLADSRDALCLAHSAPSSSYVGSTYDGYLTPDGTKIITPVLRPVPVGQTPPSCSGASQPGVAQPTPGLTPPPTAELEEFSATTGQAVSVIYTSQSHGAAADSDVYWSNPSGSVLVVRGKLRPGPKSPWVFGVLSGGKFTPIPGASNPPLIPQLAF